MGIVLPSSPIWPEIYDRTHPLTLTFRDVKDISIRALLQHFTVFSKLVVFLVECLKAGLKVYQTPKTLLDNFKTLETN